MSDVIEAGARALHREVCRHTPRRFVEGTAEDADDAWERRWRETSETIKDRYRAEARAVLDAVGVIRRDAA